jgi:hypothetical protein
VEGVWPHYPSSTNFRNIARLCTKNSVINIKIQNLQRFNRLYKQNLSGRYLHSDTELKPKKVAAGRG